MSSNPYTDTSPTRSSQDYTPLKQETHPRSSTDSLDAMDMLPMPMHKAKRASKRRAALLVLGIIGSLSIIVLMVMSFGLAFHSVELLGKIGKLVHKGNDALASITPQSHYRSYKYPCGQSAASAREAGCIFDIMTMTWMHPECHDPDLAEEFAMEGPWEFFADAEGQHALSLAELSERTGGEFSWTTRRYFVMHCVYGWKALHRAFERGWRMNSIGMDYYHTQACGSIVANQSVPLEALTTKFHIEFPSCN